MLIKVNSVKQLNAELFCFTNRCLCVSWLFFLMKWHHLLPLTIHPLWRELWGSRAWRYWGEKLHPWLRSLCVYSLSSPNESPRGATCTAFWPVLRPADCCDSSLINGGFEMKMIYSSEVWGSLQSWLTVGTGQGAMLESCAIRWVCWGADISPRTPPVGKSKRAAVEVQFKSASRTLAAPVQTACFWGWAG